MRTRVVRVFIPEAFRLGSLPFACLLLFHRRVPLRWVASPATLGTDSFPRPGAGPELERGCLECPILDRESFFHPCPRACGAAVCASLCRFPRSTVSPLETTAQTSRRYDHCGELRRPSVCATAKCREPPGTRQIRSRLVSFRSGTLLVAPTLLLTAKDKVVYEGGHVPCTDRIRSVSGPVEPTCTIESGQRSDAPDLPDAFGTTPQPSTRAGSSSLPFGSITGDFSRNLRIEL